jgi:hypothetical protein
MVAACCRIFDPNSCVETSEEYKEIVGACKHNNNTYKFGKYCDKEIQTGYSNESVIRLRNTPSWKKTSLYGVPYSVEGNTGYPTNMDQIRNKFIETVGGNKNRRYFHEWESGLTNVFVVSKSKMEEKPSICSCDKPLPDFTENTMRQYVYKTPPGFDAKLFQVHGKCVQEDGNVIELNTGSIRPVAILTPNGCAVVTNQWQFIAKSHGGVNIEFRIKNVGVVWNSKPEEYILKFLNIRTDHINSILKSRFNSHFYGKDIEWDETMKSSSRTWGELRHNHTVKLKLRKKRIHIFFQLVGRCGSHFTIYTDRIRHLEVWSPLDCVPRDEWVPIETRYTYLPFGIYDFEFTSGLALHYANIYVGVTSIDYEIMRKFGVEYSHPSRDLKTNFIKNLAGGSPTYFNWKTARFAYNWEEFLYSADSSKLLKYFEVKNISNPDEPIKIYNRIGKSIVYPLDWKDVLESAYSLPQHQYRIWQLQGWCGDHHVKTDRVIQILTSIETPTCSDEPERIPLAVCSNLQGNVTINCSATAWPVGLSINGQPLAVIPVLNLTEEAIRIRSLMQRGFSQYIGEESNWDTLKTAGKRPMESRCNRSRIFQAKNGTITLLLQIRIKCSEWVLTACYFETKLVHSLDWETTTFSFG